MIFWKIVKIKIIDFPQRNVINTSHTVLKIRNKNFNTVSLVGFEKMRHETG